MSLSYSQKLKYYKNPELAEGILKTELAKKRLIVYGARASNIQNPAYLRRNTEDYDILTKKPQKTAEELARKLNREYGGEYFKVEPAQHKGTYKVKSNVTGKTIADFTRAYRHPKVKEIGGIRYASSESIKRAISKLLKNPLAEFRKEKDLETLQRLKLGEKVW